MYQTIDQGESFPLQTYSQYSEEELRNEIPIIVHTMQLHGVDVMCLLL